MLNSFLRAASLTAKLVSLEVLCCSTMAVVISFAIRFSILSITLLISERKKDLKLSKISLKDLELKVNLLLEKKQRLYLVINGKILLKLFIGKVKFT